MHIPKKLNPNYTPVVDFFRIVEDGEGEYAEKMRRLAIDIGNSLWKVSRKPDKWLMRNLKKFFLKSQWFRKVRIIRRRLYLFRRKGRFAIVLTRGQIYNLKLMAKDAKQEARQARELRLQSA
ncbi:hypothetical protein IPM19_00265 [bacterium]|nr:MAG: hypothetical protein IPM19_00265 [bacterium]